MPFPAKLFVGGCGHRVARSNDPAPVAAYFLNVRFIRLFGKGLFSRTGPLRFGLLANVRRGQLGGHFVSDID